MIRVTEHQDAYLSSFTQRERALAGHGRPWLDRIRKDAILRFADLGFPTMRKEQWKFTSVAPIAKMPFQPAGVAGNGLTPEKLQRLPFADLGCSRLVFVNSRYRPELSLLHGLPEGVRSGSLAAALGSEERFLEEHLARYAAFQEHAFVALNTAFLNDGAFIYIPKGRVVEKPIHLLFVSTAGAEAVVSHPRTLIVMGPDSEATIIESYLGLGNGVYFTNAVNELVVGENAVVDHYKLQMESEQSFHIATLQVQQGRSSSVSSHFLSLGGALVRNDINAVLEGEGINCTLNGLYLVLGQQHVDNHTLIDHAKPHGTSQELYKGILAGKATAVFNGAIVVRKDAQKTDAIQRNKNLLLSDDAVVNTKPQLEIRANDVKCTHGATIGQLDPNAIFYLRARGIGQEAARKLLIYAFARDIISRIKIGPLQDGLEKLLFARLSQGQKAEEVR
ncbi:MAG: Fe-S cluster assembly protein SufD [Terriglobia bacterium]